MTVKRALISVSDKTGLLELAHGLVELGVELISTSGTAAYLGEHGLESTRVEDLTGVAEMLGGRVKTLHPSVHGALLARRERTERHRSGRGRARDPGRPGDCGGHVNRR